MQSWEEIRSAAQAYFDECDATRERVTLKNGEVTYRQIPYTTAGLCARLNVSKAALERARTEKPDKTKAGRARQEALAWAASRVEQHIVEHALLGELNAGMAGLVLKAWGYGSEEAKAGGAVQVVLEDPEDYGR